MQKSSAQSYPDRSEAMIFDSEGFFECGCSAIAGRVDLAIEFQRTAIDVAISPEEKASLQTARDRYKANKD